MSAINQVLSSYSSGVNASIINTDSPVDATPGLSTYTFTSASIGTASTGRVIIVGVGGSNVTVAAITITSVTIGGVSATEISDNRSGQSYCGLYSLQVDTGTTADIVVTWSGVMSACGIGVWAAYNLLSSTPTDTGTDSASDPLNTTIDVSAGGVVVAYTENYAGSTPSNVWTGVTEDFDKVIRAAAFAGQSGASGAFTTSQTGLTIDVNPSVFTNGILQVASFR